MNKMWVPVSESVNESRGTCEHQSKAGKGLLFLIYASYDWY